MASFEAEALQNGCEAQHFHLGRTGVCCPKQGFSGASDSKTRDKTGYFRTFKLRDVKLISLS